MGSADWGPFGGPGQAGEPIHNHRSDKYSAQSYPPRQPDQRTQATTEPPLCLVNQASSPVQPQHTPYNFSTQAVALPTKATLMASPTCPRGLPAHMSTIPS